MMRDPGLYDYLPYDRRPQIRWPGGARVAFWVAPNIEFYELDPPRNPARPAWARPAPSGVAISRTVTTDRLVRRSGVTGVIRR